MKKTKIFILFTLSVLLLSACRPERPAYVIGEGKMEDMLFDYHVAMAMAENADGDIESNRYLMSQAVFDKYGVTRAEFDSSMVWWCAHSEKLKDIYTKVSVRLERQAQLLGAEDAQDENVYANLSTDGDTANVWNRKPYALLINNTLDNLYQFHLDADSTYKPGDKFTLAFNPVFLSQSGNREAYVLFSLQYQNDSIEGMVREISGSYAFELNASPSGKYTDVPLKSIIGAIYLPSESPDRTILSLTDIVLVRYHQMSTVSPSDTLREDSTNQVDTLIASPEAEMDARELNKVRQTPEQIKAAGGEIHKFNIVKDVPLKKKLVRRRR